MIYIYAGLAVGIIQLVVAFGLYRGMLWAWYLAIVGCSGYLIANLIFAVLVFPDVFSIIINIACLHLLYKPKVRKYFKMKSVQ